MPETNANPEAILDAIKRIEIVAELLAEKNQHNLKMIVEGKVSGGKQIGPYARLLSYSPGEVIMNQGEWGGNTFYFSLDNELEVYVADETGKKRKVGTLPPGTCFGEMSILAGVPRNATVVSSDNGRDANVLEMVRPALRLLRSLKKFAEKVDLTYRLHGLANSIPTIQREAGEALTPLALLALANPPRFTPYAT